VKKSTLNIIKMHGWRVDRTVHHYIYYVYYHIYVSLFLKAGRFLASRFLWIKALGRAFRFVFDRYHAKVITASDARKIIMLNEDVIIGPDKSKRVIPFPYANKIILKEPEFIQLWIVPAAFTVSLAANPSTSALLWAELQPNSGWSTATNTMCAR